MQHSDFNALYLRLERKQILQIRHPIEHSTGTALRGRRRARSFQAIVIVAAFSHAQKQTAIVSSASVPPEMP